MIRKINELCCSRCGKNEQVYNYEYSDFSSIEYIPNAMFDEHGSIDRETKETFHLCVKCDMLFTFLMKYANKTDETYMIQRMKFYKKHLRKHDGDYLSTVEDHLPTSKHPNDDAFDDDEGFDFFEFFDRED